MLPSSGLRPKRQMCFNKSRQYEEKSFHFSLQIPVTAHLFHFPCPLCAVSAREKKKSLSNQADVQKSAIIPLCWFKGNLTVPSRALLHFLEVPAFPKAQKSCWVFICSSQPTPAAFQEHLVE